jgi:Ca-activated chloride channel family protein
MDLLWPGFLILLALIPILIGVYIWILRRRRKFVIRYSSLALVRAAAPHQSQWRRHVPFAIFLTSLSSLVIALARPVSIVSVPAGQTVILLAIDVSRSMCSTDIALSRLLAAEAAALSFIQSQKPNTQIGIVAFAGFAELIQPPTTDQELLQDAIESLITARRTAIGSGILKSIDAIAEFDQSVAPSTRPNSTVKPTPVPQGAYVPAIIVVLTDGVSNAGPHPPEAAQQAADRGVRVYTIGFGTASGSSFAPNCGLQNNDFNGQFGGGGGGLGGGGFRRGIDEETLMEVSEMTGGKYYAASSAGELQGVFESLPTNLITKHETTEVSVAFTAIGACLAALAIGLALWWQPLP